MISVNLSDEAFLGPDGNDIIKILTAPFLLIIENFLLGNVPVNSIIIHCPKVMTIFIVNREMFKAFILYCMNSFYISRLTMKYSQSLLGDWENVENKTLTRQNLDSAKP
jgi:hypothetical protein